MISLLLTLLFLHALPTLLRAEFHTHTCSKEYGLRVCTGYKAKPAIVVGMGKLIMRIEI